MASKTPTSNIPIESPPSQVAVPPATSTTPLTPISAISLSTISTSSSSSSSSTTQTTQPQKKKTPWGPILNLLLVLLAILLLMVSLVQTWSYIHTLFSVQDVSLLSIDSMSTAISNSSNSTMTTDPQYVNVDSGLSSHGNSNEGSGGAVKDSQAVVVKSRPLAVRAVGTPSLPRSPLAPHDSSIATQSKAKQPFTPPPQPHTAPGQRSEQKQQHTPSSPEEPKRASRKKLVAHITSVHDHLGHANSHDQTSKSDTDQNIEETTLPTPQTTVILTICAALGVLVGCFCCILGSFRLAVCCYYRRRGIVVNKGGRVCVAGKRIGPPRSVSSTSFGDSSSSSSSSSSASLVSPSSPPFESDSYHYPLQHLQQQQVQMSEFWNVESLSKDSKKSPISSFPPSPSFFSSKGRLFKTLGRSSFTSTEANVSASTTNKNYKKKDAPPSRLPLAVTGPTAQVISSPVDFIPAQHSLDSPSSFSFSTLSVPERGLDSSSPPPHLGRGWNNLEFDPLFSPHPSSSSTTGSGTGTKSRRMPAHSPFPLPLPLSLSLKHNPSSQHASSSLSSGLISPCTAMTPLTATSSDSCCSSSNSRSRSGNEMSPFPWSKYTPYMDNNDSSNCNAGTGSKTMVRAQKPHPIDTDPVSTLKTPFTLSTGTAGTSAAMMMMYASSRSTRLPLSSPGYISTYGTSFARHSTTAKISTPILLSPRLGGSGTGTGSGTGAVAGSGTRSGSISRDPHPHDYAQHHHNHLNYNQSDNSTNQIYNNSKRVTATTTFHRNNNSRAALSLSLSHTTALDRPHQQPLINSEYNGQCG